MAGKVQCFLRPGFLKISSQEIKLNKDIEESCMRLSEQPAGRKFEFIIPFHDCKKQGADARVRACPAACGCTHESVCLLFFETYSFSFFPQPFLFFFLFMLINQVFNGIVNLVELFAVAADCLSNCIYLCCQVFVVEDKLL